MSKLVNFNIAKLATNKGFDEPCLHAFDPMGNEVLEYTFLSYTPDEPEINYRYFLQYKKDNIFLRPTQSQLQSWLRDKHNIKIFIVPSDCDFSYLIKIGNVKLDGETYKDYETALEVALNLALLKIEM